MPGRRLQSVPYPRAGDGCASGIVGIAEYEKLKFPVQAAEKIRHIHLEILFFFQRIVRSASAGEGDGPLIFSGALAQDQSLFGTYILNKKRDQFGCPVAHQQMFRSGSRVGGNRLPQSRVLPVGIAGDDVQVVCQFFFYFRGDPQRVDIGGETDDVLLFI